MILNPDTIAAAAKQAGISKGDLIAILEEGESVAYNAADYLFHENTPRQWLGILLEGDVDNARYWYGRAGRRFPASFDAKAEIAELAAALKRG